MINNLLKKANPVELLSREGIDLTQIPAFVGLNASLLLFSLNPALMAGLAAANGAFLALQILRKQRWRESIRTGKLVQEMSKVAEKYCKYLQTIETNLKTGVSIKESSEQIEAQVRSFQNDFNRLLKQWQALLQRKDNGIIPLEQRLSGTASRDQLTHSREDLPKDAQLILSLEKLGESVKTQVEKIAENEEHGDKIKDPVKFFQGRAIKIAGRLRTAKSEDIKLIQDELATLKSEIEKFSKASIYGNEVKTALTGLLNAIDEEIFKKSVPARGAQLEAEKRSKESLEEKTGEIQELRKKILTFAALSEQDRFKQFDAVFEAWILLVRSYSVENDNMQSDLTTVDRASLAQTFKDKIEDVFEKYLQPIIDSRKELSERIFQKIKSGKSKSSDLENLELKITNFRANGKISEEQKEYLLKKLKRKKQIVEAREQIKNGTAGRDYLQAINMVHNRLKENNVSNDELNEYKDLLDDLKNADGIIPVEHVQLIRVRAILKEKMRVIQKGAGSAESTQDTSSEAPLKIETPAGTETTPTPTPPPATPAEEVRSSESKKEFDAAKAQKEVGEMLSEWEETDDQNYSGNDEKIKWAWYQAVYVELDNLNGNAVKTQIDEQVKEWAKSDGNSDGKYQDKDFEKMQQGWATKEVVEEMLKDRQASESEESTARVVSPVTTTGGTETQTPKEEDPAKTQISSSRKTNVLPSPPPAEEATEGEAETGTGGETAAAAETPEAPAAPVVPAPATSPEADSAQETQISSSRATEVISKNLTGIVKFNAMEIEKKQATLDAIAEANRLFQNIRLKDVMPSIEQINLNKGQITKIVISPKGNFSTMDIGSQALTFGGSEYHHYDNENKNIEISVSYEGSNVKVAVTSAQDRNITVDSLVLECNPNDTVSLVFAQDGSLVSTEGVVRDFPNGILGLILSEEKKERSDDLISFLQNNYKKRVRFEYTGGSLGKIILWQNIWSKLLAIARLFRPVQNELRKKLTALGPKESQNQSPQRTSASDLIISVKPK